MHTFKFESSDLMGDPFKVQSGREGADRDHVLRRMMEQRVPS